MEEGLQEAQEFIKTYSEQKEVSAKVKRAPLLACCGIVCGFCLLISPFITPAFRKHCLPYVPATRRQIDLVLNLRKNTTGLLVDVGSGDGRLVIQSAKRGWKSHGIELNRWLVYYSRFLAWKEGVSHLTTFFRQDLWKTDLSPYDTVVIFGTSEMMLDFEKKLEKELKSNAEVIAGRFGLSKWVPYKQFLDPKRNMGLYNVFAYKKQFKHRS
ncbi:ATP synthase subunit C lysine N-methyltransferase-like [Zophobas morio]|uniref:ATP synthase subunit C lysine N-methyltransferase-like n=1 Tax=Zophobas morio TaxID=2755281 RepID=UPI0030830F50